jgi:putative transposase
MTFPLKTAPVVVRVSGNMRGEEGTLMKSQRYTEEPIRRILQEVEFWQPGGGGLLSVGSLRSSVHRWRSKYQGADQASLKRLRELEAENSQPKKIVAQQVLDSDALKELAGTEW